ncbi:MAG TPA: hypothetical protein VNT53_06460 [Pseudolysinimonas sp.]|nr:hypothetical protein [Pseudolysinimonas sp.]
MSLLGVALLAGALLAIAPATPASAVPVGCTSDLIYATNTNQIRSRTPSGAINVINTGTLSANTIALNPVDGQLYGFPTNTGGLGNHLFRIEADGSNTDLGAITGLPAATYALGGFDDTGTLWMTSGLSPLYRVDVSTLTATTLALSSSVNGDLAFIDGALYAGVGFTQLARINVTTGNVTVLTVPGWAIASSFWSVDGHLYGNTGTTIREVLNYATATPTFTVVASGLPGPVNDGASCLSAASPFLNAMDDDFSASPVTTTAGGTVSSVFANDLNNGAAFASIDVTATLQSDGGLTGATLAPDGTTTVPAGATPGSYTLGYRICLVSNPALCDTAVALVVVQASLDAVDDDFSSNPATTAGGDVGNVLTNDVNDGAAVASTDVTATLQSNGGLTGASLALDGTVTVPVGATPGSYTLGYQICLTVNAAVCDTATFLVVVVASPAIQTGGGGALAVSGVSSIPYSAGAAVLLLMLGTLMLGAARVMRSTGS